MRKEIIVVDKELGIYRVTTPDSRFYLKEGMDKVTGLPVFSWKPSITWISGFYPKGIQFYKYLASKGWDESQAIMEAAGSKGSKVHQGVENLIAGGTIKMDDKYTNNSTGLEEELSVEEYEALVSFANWVKETQPNFILNEIVVESEKYNYAGTCDCVAKIGDHIYIIDFKTGQNIWPEYEIQIAAYKQALKEMGKKVDGVRLAFLQLGYKKNKRGYKFTEVDDKFELFLHAKAIWSNECENDKPKQHEYPLSISLNLAPKERGGEGGVASDSPKPSKTSPRGKKVTKTPIVEPTNK